MVVTTKCGVKVEFDGDRVARILAPKHRYGSLLYGLCGNCDGKRRNDLLVQGKPLQRGRKRRRDQLQAFARQFLVRDASGLPSDDPQ